MRAKTQKKKMTLDTLAVMVQNGFVDLEKKLGDRIDGVEDNLSMRLDRVESRLDSVSDDVSVIKKALIEKHIVEKKVFLR